MKNIAQQLACGAAIALMCNAAHANNSVDDGDMMTAAGANASPSSVAQAVQVVVQVPDAEPNNSAAAAQVVAVPGAVVRGTLSAGDVDFFKLTLPAGKELVVQLSHRAAANFDLAVFNANGGLIARSNNVGRPDRAVIANNGRNNVTLVVRANFVSLRAGASAADRAYTLLLAQRSPAAAATQQ